MFGAFINLGDNIDGLLHISDMSWTKVIKHPKEFLSIDYMKYWIARLFSTQA